MVEITRQEAFDMSIKKWTPLAKGEQPESDICGFCAYYPDIDRHSCGECPLSPDICGWDSDAGLYEDWERTEDPKIAKQILEAIKERGEKWIKEEKQ